MQRVHPQKLTYDSGTEFTSKAVAASASVTTDPIDVENSSGYGSVLVVLANSGTSTPQVDVSMEVSLNGVDFYTPYDAAGNSVGTVVSNLTASRWQALSFPLASKLRFVVAADTSSTVSMAFIQKES